MLSRSTSNSAGSGSLKSYVKSILNSQLSKSILLTFFAVTLLEFAFLAVLCLDVLTAEQAASREFDLLNGARSISRIVKLAGASIDAAKESIKEAGDPDKYENYLLTVGATIDAMDSLKKDFKKKQIDPSGLALMRDSFAKLDQTARDVHAQVKKSGGAEEALDPHGFLTSSAYSLYKTYTAQIEHTRIALTTKAVNTAVAGIEPKNVLMIAALSNLLLLVALGASLRKAISSPIGKLARGCQQIMEGELIKAPLNMRNEVSTLERSFHEMSLVIMENEKRRRSFLEFFQSMQSAALEKVKACFDALLAESSLLDRARKSIEKAKLNLGTLLQLLQSMTEALSFGANKTIEVHYKETSSSELIAGASAAVEGLLAKRHVSLKIEAENEIPCSLDPQLIGRVLLNFLSNAIKYSPENDQITLSLKDENRNLHFRISDRGPGISEEGQTKLFKEFSQLEAADGVKRAGSGLGLMICKEIVEAHGGQVGIESQVGKGSTFWFVIPAFAEKKKVQEKKPKTTKRSSSLDRSFILMLILFLLPQSLLLFKLNSLFDSSSTSFQSFAVEKEIFLRSEELLGLYLSWKLKVLQAVEKQDFGQISAANEIIEEQIDHCKWMLDHLQKENPSYEQVKRMISGLAKLRKFGIYVGRRKDELSLAAVAPLVKQARKISKEIETAGFEIRDIEDARMVNSYSGSQSTNSELLATLSLAALINLLVLAAIAAVALSITKKLGELKQKTKAFAAGERLAPSLKGSDDLAFLDGQLCQVSQAIRDADEQRQKLIAVINHDLRTPLTAIINALELILASGYGEIGEKEMKLSKEAEQELSKLLQQINDLLLLEKIDAGLYQLSKQKFEVLPVLSAAMKSFDLDASKRGIKLVPSLERSQGKLVIEGDPALIEREFSIILSNAIKAAPDGSRIDCSVKRDGNQISVSVKDQGPGISQDLLPQIFERFRFLDGKPVAGLGLPLAQRLCQVHGGSLAISCSDSGTQTLIMLPLLTS